MKSQPQKPSPRWLCVFELDDSAGQRRIPGKPSVRVEQKSIKPGPDLEAWLEKTKASKRPELIRVRYDLMPESQQRLVYLLAHKSQEAAKESFTGFRADADWLAAKKASEETAGGSLTVKENGVLSEFLVPTEYSPLR